MKIHRYLIGVTAGLVSALVFSSVASADVTGLNIEAKLTPTKQSKKVRGPVNIFFSSDDAFAGDLPCPLGTANSPSCYAFPPSVQTLITFTKDLKFDPGNLPDCQLSRIIGQSTAGAKAACPGSLVGGGGSVQTFSDGRRLSGTLTAFNGAPSGGNPSLYIHTDIPGVQTKPILNIVIRGSVMNVQVPPVQGSVIDDFNITLNGKKVVGKSGGKKRYYASIRCSKGKWPVSETVTYQNGKSETDSKTYKCKQKK